MWFLTDQPGKDGALNHSTIKIYLSQWTMNQLIQKQQLMKHLFYPRKEEVFNFWFAVKFRSFVARVKSGIYKSEEDIKSDSHWLNCLKGCNWWIHSRSSGFHYQYSDGGKKSLDSWANRPQFLPQAHAKSWTCWLGWRKKKKRLCWKEAKSYVKTHVNKIYKKIEIEKCSKI